MPNYKFFLLLALALGMSATVPATAGPHCQEDLGYGVPNAAVASQEGLAA